MLAAEFRAQYPSGYDHDVVLKIKSACPPWAGAKGRFLSEDGDFVVLEVTSSDERKYRVRLPWAQVQFDKPEGKS